MAQAARSLGYKFLCITDHSQSTVIANGQSPERLARQIEQIHKTNAKLKGITLLSGAEVDILADGRLDFENGLLSDLDYVVASIHSGLGGPRERVTMRTLKAMDNPYVSCIGHPTGRVIGRREAMDLGDLERLLAEAPRPSVVVASAGTVDTGDFDDFRGLAELKRTYGFWLHVDGAFGGFAACSPELRSLIEGWEVADSICIDLHKWLNVPYDAAVAFTRHRDLQVDVFSSAAAYLGHPGERPAPIHLAPESSHRWRALPAWFSLTAYGADGHREIVERDCRLARELGARMERSPAFELLAPVRLNIVCFALAEAGRTEAFIETVRDDGRTFVSPTVIWGRQGVRAAFSNWRTTERDLDTIWEALLGAAEGGGRR